MQPSPSFGKGKGLLRSWLLPSLEPWVWPSRNQPWKSCGKGSISDSLNPRTKIEVMAPGKGLESWKEPVQRQSHGGRGSHLPAEMNREHQVERGSRHRLHAEAQVRRTAGYWNLVGGRFKKVGKGAIAFQLVTNRATTKRRAAPPPVSEFR